MTDDRSIEPTTLAKSPGRSTLLSLTAMPTSLIRLAPELIQAIRDVAPRPRRRVRRYAIAGGLVAVLAGVFFTSIAPFDWASLHALAQRNDATLPPVDTSSSAPEPAPLVVAAAPPNSASSPAPPATGTLEERTSPPALGTTIAASASLAALGKQAKTPRKPHRRAPR